MFEVRTDTICEGWVNCWHVGDELQTFETIKAAQAEIDEYIDDRKQDYLGGDLEDFDEDAEREEFRIFYVETGEACDFVEAEVAS